MHTLMDGKTPQGGYQVNNQVCNYTTAMNNMCIKYQIMKVRLSFNSIVHVCISTCKSSVQAPCFKAPSFV